MSDVYTAKKTARDGKVATCDGKADTRDGGLDYKQVGIPKTCDDKDATQDNKAVRRGDVQVLKKAPDVKLQVKHVAAYCRVSTDREEQKSSIKTQMDSFQKLIENHPGWELTEIYADEGISGTQALHREAFTRMIEDCRDGKIDRILTKSISRFARNTVDCLSYVRELRSYGVSVYFEKENMDTESEVSEMALSIMAAVAQEESRNLSDNMKWGVRKRFKEGKVKWSPVYGYKKVGGEEFVIDSETAPVVRRIFDEYAQGKSLLQIKDGLDKDGITGPGGRGWHPAQLSRILGNEKYVGDAQCQKTCTIDHITHTKVKNDQTTVPSYYIRNHHDAIVPRKTYEMVQKIRTMKDQHNGPTQYPYMDLITCPICGRKLERVLLQRHGIPAAWHCNPERGNVNCAGYYIKEEYIDEVLREAYRNLDMEAVRELAEGTKDEDDTDAAVDTAKAVDTVKTVDTAKAAESKAAEEAIRMKEEMPELDTVEYFFLNAMVKEIRFKGWDTAVILWKCGLQSEVQIPYIIPFDIPFSKQQMSTAVVDNWVMIAAKAAGDTGSEQRAGSEQNAVYLQG